mgnify:CR=1 FL=1
MDGFNTFEKQDKVLLGLNSGADAAAAYRILQQQGFAVLTFTAEDTADFPAAPATLLPLLAEQAAKLDCAFDRAAELLRRTGYRTVLRLGTGGELWQEENL